ncbi:glutamate--cysteine ligase [Coemansia sp. RSA 552]|nr:glutamate--cysteine ligase [Coemansia sp. RSA 552]
MADSPQTKMYSWKEILPRMEEIRNEAMNQFIAAWKTAKASRTQDFAWHETMGYVIVKRDDAARRAVLSTRAPELLKEIGCTFDPCSVTTHPQAPSRRDRAAGPLSPAEEAQKTGWRPAHARFALRCEPPYLRPFSLEQLAIELPECLRARRRILKEKLSPDEMLLSISQFPLLGSGTYVENQGAPNGSLLRSHVLSDVCLNPVAPFTLEIGGICDRRGTVPYTGVAVFRDTETKWPFTDDEMPPDPFKGGFPADCMPPGRDGGRDSACSISSTAPVASGSGGSNGATADPAPHGVSPVAQPQLLLDLSQLSLRPSPDSMPTSIEHPVLVGPPTNKNCLLLDSPLFGIGSGGVLRVTLCAADLDEARLLYDHLAPISAIMTALTAATPVVRGHLVDRDSYWDVLCNTVDDRTARERGLIPMTPAKHVIPKSRYGSIDAYLGPEDPSTDQAWSELFNDREYIYNRETYWRTTEECRMDLCLSTHVARLLSRDIHYASERMLSGRRGSHEANATNGPNGTRRTRRHDGQEHFKRFMGCVRQNVCLYPPNTRTGSGWEVEFMSLETQLTDAENAAFITFIVLLSRVIISYRLNMYLPISLMDENMARAQKVDAAKSQRFFFRRDLFGGRDGKSTGSGRITLRDSSGNPRGTINTVNTVHMVQYEPSVTMRGRYGSSYCGSARPEHAEYVELTIDEIINGSKEYGVPGILTIILSYLPTLRLEYDVEQALRRQLLLIKRRASGKLCTLASWMRNYIRSHPEYRRDSVVSQSINYDMLRTMNDIEEGKVTAPELLG